VEEFTVTPWEVKGRVDYEKLIKIFGTEAITRDLLERLERLAGGELHVLLRRGVFFSHRDFDKILDDLEKGKGFFLYTGRGPSGPMHIGHLIPFILTKWFQDRFRANVYIMITDDEKFLDEEKMSLEEARHWAFENTLDIIAVGFDPDRTFIFHDTEYIGKMYPLAIKIAKKINYNLVRAVFGFTGSTNIGLLFYPALQIVPTFFEKKRSGSLLEDTERPGRVIWILQSRCHTLKIPSTPNRVRGKDELVKAGDSYIPYRRS